MNAKPVYLDGVLMPNVSAHTTAEAARHAAAAGVAIDPESACDRAQHVGEGPVAFYVSARPGEYRGPR